MGKDIYHGPLEQVNECCWRIPKSYKEGMRVELAEVPGSPARVQLVGGK